MSTNRRGAWKRTAAALSLLVAVACAERPAALRRVLDTGLAKLEKTVAAACAQWVAAAYVTTP